jgi:uncharacterized membrane protein YedE/YeeE
VKARPVRNTPGIIGGLFGAAFGFLLAAAQLHEYDTIHAMLRLEEPDVFLLMGAAIGVSAPLLWWLERHHVQSIYGGPIALSRSKPQRHHLVGGVLFGTGWALAGTCPAPALVMVSSGAVLGLVAIAGLFIGLSLRDRHTQRVPADGDGEHRSPVPASPGR